MDMAKNNGMNAEWDEFNHSGWAKFMGDMKTKYVRNCCNESLSCVDANAIPAETSAGRDGLVAL